MISTYAVGASKILIKNIKDVTLFVSKGSSTILYAKLIEESGDGLCLFQLENYVLTPIDGNKNKGRVDVENIE